MTKHYHTGSELLDAIYAKRDAIRTKLYPRAAPHIVVAKNFTFHAPVSAESSDGEIEKFVPPLRSSDKVKDIQNVVAWHFGIDHNDIISGLRARRVARARMIAIYLCRQLTTRSKPDIGRRFGRDHSTVFHAICSITSIIDGVPWQGKKRYRIRASDAGVGVDIAAIKEMLGYE